MGRPRRFSDQAVLEVAARVFVEGGYEGTSIDDLVRALNLHRGSLYKAFGSKRGLFLAVLRQDIQKRTANMATSESGCRDPAQRPDVDLLLTAALELGHRDAEVATLVRRAFDLIEMSTADPAEAPCSASNPAPYPARAAELLGARLYERLHSDPDQPNTHHRPTDRET